MTAAERMAAEEARCRRIAEAMDPESSVALMMLGRAGGLQDAQAWLREEREAMAARNIAVVLAAAMGEPEEPKHKWTLDGTTWSLEGTRWTVERYRMIGEDHCYQVLCMGEGTNWAEYPELEQAQVVAETWESAS